MALHLSQVRQARAARARAQLDCFGETIFGVELRGVTRISEAVAQGVGGPWLAAADNRQRDASPANHIPDEGQ
jgi:hypothetical protein